jgi:hypothetical protein
MMRRLPFVLFVASLGACRCESQDVPQDASAPEAAPSASASAKSDDQVKPVYPDVPPDALATKLCNALHATESRRRRECCNTPDTGVTAAEGVAVECTRNVSAALKLASITITPVDVETCAAAMERTFSGCDWVGPLPPQVAHECQGILHGKLADGAVCRSTLECGAGLLCHGVGPTTTGKCGPVHHDGERCSRSADVLVTYARQDAIDETKPQCTSVCLRGRCVARVKSGEACESSDQCEPGTFCRNTKCTKAPAKAGEHCDTATLCEATLACQPSGRCGPARKPSGAACASDLECAAGCIKPPAAKSGTCGMKCP